MLYSKPFFSSSIFSSKRKRAFRSQRQDFAYTTLEARQLLATISWSSGDIVANSDVSTNGTLAFAINASDGSGVTTTANGVDFVTSTRVNAAAQSQAQSPGNESLSVLIGNDNGNAFENGGLNGGVGTLILGGWWGANTAANAPPNTASVTLNGLSIGDEYEVQIFSNDARNNRHDGYITRLDNGAGGTGIDLELNNQPSGDRAGDFGIGTFTADGSNQTITLSGFLDGNDNDGRIQVNAIQLRKLEPVVLLPGSVPLLNEFSASNSSIIDDDNGNSTDWIEIYNAGEDAVNLAGYSLTDDATNISKYVFPNTTLAGGEYLVVFAGDDADPTTGTDLYTSFGLSSAGEYLGFYDDNGALLTEFGASGADYPAQFEDVSYGLESGTLATSFFGTPTPGSANVNPIDGVIESLPTVSVDRGFYEQSFPVTVESQAPGAILVYTTDGTEPSLTNGTQVQPANANSLATTTMTISTTTVLRTASLVPGIETRGATTHTYVFLDDVITSSVLDTDITQDPRYANQLRDGLLDIPTLSFNYDNTIENSFTPEQRASVEWLAPDGSEGFQLDAGIHGFGGFFTNFAKKNFRLQFRSEYGSSRLEFPLFEGFDNGIPATDSFDALDFRSGSHDMSQRGFYHSNRFVDDTLLDLGHVAPHGRFVHIYTNGVYWGQYHMRERWDADFLSQYYGGDADDYEAINGNVNNGNQTPNGWAPGEVYDGDGSAWDHINPYFPNNQGNPNVAWPTNDALNYQQMSQVVNMENYIDYMLIYMAGSSENEYRAGGSADGSVPYTFYLNDADGWLRGTGDRTNNAGPGNILGGLVAEGDPEFLTLYADRIQNLFGEGGALSPERAVERLQVRMDEIERSFLLESARWGARTPDSYNAAAATAIQDMLPNIAPEMLANLRARGLFPSFDAPGYQVNGLAQHGGEVNIGDTLTLNANGTVFYTTDGSDPRLVGGGINPNAIAYNGGSTTSTVFGSGSTWKYLVTGTDQGTAWRAGSFNDNSWPSGVAEIGYGDNNEATTIGFGGDANDKNITTYFRKTFNVTAQQLTDVVSASFELQRDDGAVVYLNGQEIGRSNLPGGTINYSTLASSAVGGASENSFFTDITLDPSDLNVGSNTLAIEIHQVNPTSSDISFDARLSLTSQTSAAGLIALNTSTNFQSRTFVNGEWSAVSDATFVIPASQSDLRISELHYNPADPSVSEIAAGFVDNDEFEFIEILNPQPVGAINLLGVQLSNGVTFSFGDVDLLPGERAVIVENVAAFRARYGDSATVLGEWSGGLNNGGERVTLVDSSLTEIASVNYGDGDPWYSPTDGQGYSLVLNDPANTPADELGKYYSWRVSTELGGTPGEASAQPSGVVINEVLAHTDAPQSDAIELFNPTASAIDIGGWFLSDSSNNLQKYVIPAGTTISAGGYLVFDESDFNPNPANPGLNHFALASGGDEVYLSQLISFSNTTGLVFSLEDSVEFGATFNGESLGRLPDGSGRLTRLASNSLGSVNGEAEVGPLVISEINYHPEDPNAAALAIDSTLTASDLEFIEIANPTGAAINLTNWRIRGEADFDFAAGTTLAAGAAIVVVSFDPALEPTKLAAIEAHYGISSGVTIVGGFSGSLSNSSARISLQQPDAPDALGVIPHVVVDEVVYDDVGPWPVAADGAGQTLHRDELAANGNLASSWIAEAATPGLFENDFILGDANLNGVVNFGDISAFITLLQTGTYLDQADANQDGVLNFADISHFITLLQNGGQQS